MAELDRRDFLKLVGAGAGAAAAAGCAEPVEKLVPYVIQPETITPGLATFYASTCTECPASCGLHVRTREGRPVKLEGNPEHPINRGALCARGQASIGRTYHPDRYAGPMQREPGGEAEPIARDAAHEKVVERIKAAPRKTWVLGAPTGPTLTRLIDTWVKGVGAGHVVYEPFSDEALREATRQVLGVEATPVFDVSSADLIVDFGSEFLDTGASPCESMRQFSEARSVAEHPDGGAVLVSIGPRLSMTASNASRWLPARPGSEGPIALALAAAVYDHHKKQGTAIPGAAAAEALFAGIDRREVASRAGIDAAKLDELAEQLVAAKAAVALPPGVALSSARATEAIAAVLVLNAMLGAVGSRVVIPAGDTHRRAATFSQVKDFVAQMKAGQVDVLLIHGSNPVYSLPSELGFAEALEKVGLVVSTATLVDETSERADLVLPDHSPLESWGDAEPRPGVRSIVQPTVRPLHDSQALGDTLLDLGRALGAPGLPAGSFRNVLESAWSDTNFREALARGGVFGESPAQSVALSPSVAGLQVREPTLKGSGDYTLVAYPHSYLGDGSGAALPWLQELPDPVTKISWSSWAELSKATAKKLGVTFGDVVSIDTGVGTPIEVSVFPRGGVRDDVVAVAIGQGHTAGHYASLAGDGQPHVARGANVIDVIPAEVDEKSGARAWLAAKARVSPTGDFRRLALSQWTDNQRGRGLAQEVSLLALAKDETHGDHEALADHGQSDEGGHEFVLPFEPANDSSPDSEYRWGMVIDNDRCTGCSACIAACYTENNIPIVGEEQAIRHREMTWIRIERYIGEGNTEGGEERRPYPDREQLGETDVRIAPMLCQHCGAAPCEAVCPVIATYHTPEGVNGMVYNRCVGTRYCANNCVYKVRRFNYFDYSMDNWPGLLGLMLNPDVTVRGQGVMEKCTFCIQRIEGARKTAKEEGRAIGGDEVVTACQQTCPTHAITFGNTKDKDSAVSKKADEQARKYHSLQVLNTRPAITYLAQVNRLPDDDHHSDEGGHA